MKKVLFILIAWLCTINVQAQQDSLVLMQIEATGTSIHSMECRLRNTMKRPNKQEEEKVGDLKYLTTNFIDAHFSEDEYIIMNGNKMKIHLGIFNGTFRTDRNPLIKPISRMLVCAINGQCLKIAEENDYDLALSEDSESYNVTLTTRKKKLLGIGYRRAVFSYGKDNFRLKSILLIDYKDNHDLYSFENQVFDKDIDKSAFKL